MFFGSYENEKDNKRQFKITIRDFCNLLEQEYILTEGQKGKSKNITFRLDKPNAYANQQIHVHVDQNKLHYAWNQDGSRSHTGRWPSKEPSRAIKQIAADQLGISMDLLESYMDLVLISDLVEDEELELLLESVMDIE